VWNIFLFYIFSGCMENFYMFLQSRRKFPFRYRRFRSAWFWPLIVKILPKFGILCPGPTQPMMFSVFTTFEYKTPMLHVDWPGILTLFFDVVCTFYTYLNFSTRSIVNVVSKIIGSKHFFSQVWPIRSLHWGSNNIEDLRLINTFFYPALTEF